MKDTKKLIIPLIGNLEEMDFRQLDLAMENKAAKGFINEAGWQKKFPYTPVCSFAIARSRTHIAILFHNRGLDLRASVSQDNGKSWEDSCCEFFVSDPYDGTYYNFELTCIGFLRAGKGADRNNRKLIGQNKLDEVIRYTSLPHKNMDIEGNIYSWTAGMAIPLSLIGVDPENPPIRLSGNFYKCADKTEHQHFLSWNKIKSDKPDFHRPEYFGEMILK
ncbi:MAG: carbohydrate-binding family 9-like protein [Bacteroidales bacterium]|jgi:hypothetical protein|nr:carbohydrate-binding family 9-like protein [Bacteroidales bacterium]MCI1785031.1 carbohydrate-binding family 9-like protein [Bacteroidales bacterium]